MRFLRTLGAVVALIALADVADAGEVMNGGGGGNDVIEDSFDSNANKQDFFTKLPLHFPKGDKGDTGFVG